MKNFHRLMAKDIFGCLTPEEREELLRLRDEMQITDRQYQAMKQQSISRELHQDILRTRRRPSMRWKKVFRYAALFILPLTVGIYLLIREYDIPSPFPATQVSKIVPLPKPERKQPQLILADGEIVKLKREGRQELVAPRILNTGETLEYQAQPASTPEDTLRFNTILVPAAGEFNIKLSDGTRIWLNENTRLKYPETFIGATREIHLAEGEIYLEVARNPEHPFLVHTPNGRVEVLGTHFNIRCYGPQKVETTLAEGSVRVSGAGEETILKPGQQAVVTDRIQVAEADIEEVTCWKDNLFFFKNAPLEVILDKLASWYNCEVFWQNQEIKNTRYFMYIDKYASVDEILEKLSEAGNIRLNIQGKAIFVSK